MNDKLQTKRAPRRRRTTRRLTRKPIRVPEDKVPRTSATDVPIDFGGTKIPDQQGSSMAGAPKADAPKADAPKADAPKADAPKADVPQTAVSPAVAQDASDDPRQTLSQRPRRTSARAEPAEQRGALSQWEVDDGPGASAGPAEPAPSFEEDAPTHPRIELTKEMALAAGRVTSPQATAVAPDAPASELAASGSAVVAASAQVAPSVAPQAPAASQEPQPQQEGQQGGLKESPPEGRLEQQPAVPQKDVAPDPSVVARARNPLAGVFDPLASPSQRTGHVVLARSVVVTSRGSGSNEWGDADLAKTDPRALIIEEMELGAEGDAAASRERSPTPPPPPKAQPQPQSEPQAQAQPQPQAQPEPQAHTDKRPTPPRPSTTERTVWWKTFFDEEYLRTTDPPADAQIVRQCDFIVDCLELTPGQRVLDLGSGLGLQAINLARRGLDVVGLDISSAMLEAAREEASEAGAAVHFLQGDMLDLEAEAEFDAVLLLGTTLGCFDDDGHVDLMRRVHRALKPNGRLFVEVVNRDHVLASQPNLVWFQGTGAICMEESDFNFFTSRLVVKRTVMRDSGRQHESEFSLRLFSLHEVGQLIQSVGFRVNEVSASEATRGMFFGTHSQRLLLSAQKR